MVRWFHRWLPWFAILLRALLVVSINITIDHEQESSIGPITTNSASVPTTLAAKIAPSTTATSPTTEVPLSVLTTLPVQHVNINKNSGNKFNGEHNFVSHTDSNKNLPEVTPMHGILKKSEVSTRESTLHEDGERATYTILDTSHGNTTFSVSTDKIIESTTSVIQPGFDVTRNALLPTPTSTTTEQSSTMTGVHTYSTIPHSPRQVHKASTLVPVTAKPTIVSIPGNSTEKHNAFPTVDVDEIPPTGGIHTNNKSTPTILGSPENSTAHSSVPKVNVTTYNNNDTQTTHVARPTATSATPKVFISNLSVTSSIPTNVLEANFTTVLDRIDTLLPFYRRHEWEDAKIAWGWAWEFHVYATGVLFSFVAVINFCCCLRLHCFQKLPGRGYFVALNIVLLTLGLTRAGSYFEDAYNLSGVLPNSLAFFLFDIGFACLTSAFAILFLALLQATKVVILPGGMQRPPALASVIMFHCCVTVMADVLAGEIGTRLKFLIVCVHAFSVSWLFCMTVTYFWAFRLLYVAALRKQGEIIRVTFTKLHIEGAPLPPRIPNPSLALAVRVVLVAACLGFILCFVQLLGLLGVYKVGGIHFPLPWGWWVYQSVNRSLEFLLVSALTYVATQPLHHNDLLASQESCCSVGSVLSCCTCMTSSLSTDDIYPTYCASNAAVARTNFTFERWETANSAQATNDAFPGSGQLSAVQGLGLPFSQGRPEINTVSTLSSAPAGCAHSSTSLTNKSEFRSLGSRPQFTRATLATLSDFHSTRNRPTASMLLNENGFIRFRANGDLEPTVITDEGTYVGRKELGPGSARGIEGPAKQTGNCTPILQGVLKDYHTYRVSGGSIDTDLSSPDHMGAGNTRHACLHRYGSACSSESAATSFDVHFYLNPPTMTKTQELCRRRSANSTPCKEVGVQSDRVVGVRPAAPPNLNLPSSPAMMAPVNGQQSQDITPDSAIFLEMPTTDDEHNQDGGVLIRNFPGSTEEHDLSFSQSLNDLHCNTSNSSNGVTPRHRHRSRSLLARLKGSSFSLTSHHGYEPLESRVQSQSTLGRKSRMWRTSSEDPLRTQHPNHPNYKEFKQWEMRTVFRGSGASSRMSRDPQRDSFYNSDVSMTTGSREMVMYVDTEVQTEPMEFIPPPPLQTPVPPAPVPHQESVV